MKFTHNEVLKKLRGYKELNKKVLQLEFELKHMPDTVSSDDIIKSETLFQRLSERISDSNTSKTPLVYDETTMKNMKMKEELEQELSFIKSEIRRLEYYINLLDEKEKIIISLVYLENKNYDEIKAEFNISPDYFKRHRKAGISKLLVMYNNLIV